MKAQVRVVLFLLLAGCAAGAAAQNSPPRGGKWEFTLQPSYTHSQSFDSGNGTSGTVSSSLGFGFGVAYNLNNNLALGGGELVLGLWLLVFGVNAERWKEQARATMERES